jgi:large repetitive protein
MRIDRAPYWYPGLDGWNAAIAVVLTAVIVVTAATGGATAPLVASTPTISQPAPGTSLGAAAPGAIVGQAPPGSAVRIYDGDKLLGETKADQAGNFRFSLPALAPGPHTLSTRVTDANGKPIASSAPIPVTVSGGPLALVSPTPAGAKPGAQAPTFTGLPQGTQWPSGMPVMLSGTAPPGSKVQVFANDKLIGETVAGQDGKWSLPLPALPPGNYFLTARAFGPDGVLLGESAPVKVSVVGPGTPTVAVQPAVTAGLPVTRTAVVTSAAGTTPKVTVMAALAATATLTGPAATAQAAAATAQAARPVITGLTDGAQLLPGTPLAGIAAPGTKIRLFDGDKQIGETTAGPDGKWSLVLPALAAGAHALTASVLGSDGRVLGTSAPLNATVGGAPGTAVSAAGTPAGVAIAGTVRPTGVVTGTSQAAQAAGATTGTPGSTQSGGATVIAGTARPAGAGAGTSQVAQAAGAAAGTPGPTRPGGTAAITGTARPTGAGAETPQAAQPAGATTGTPGPARPGGTAAARPGTVAPTAGTAAAAAAPGGAGVGLPAGEPIFLTGTADPGAKLRIFSDNAQVGEAVADSTGQWRLMLPALQTGTHELIARIFDAAGKLASSSAPLTVTIAGGATPGAAAPTTAGTPSPPATTAALPAITGPLSGASVSAASPGALEGKAEPGSTIRVYDGDKLVAEIVVGPDGTWRVMLPQMAEGPHTFVVRVVSPDGSEAVPSTPVVVVVRPALITTPATAAPRAADAAGPSVSSPAAGGAIQSSQPLLTGSAAPGGTVRIYDGQMLLDETKADSAGRWTSVPPIPLAVGKHALGVTGVGPDGVEAPAEVLEMVIAEGATGLKPLMFSASYGKAPSPFGLLEGTAPPGAIVVLYDGDVRVVKIPVDSNGLWQYALPARTRLGEHQYSIVVTSSDGTTIYRSQTVPVRIGAVPPPFLPRTGLTD